MHALTSVMGGLLGRSTLPGRRNAGKPGLNILVVRADEGLAIATASQVPIERSVIPSDAGRPAASIREVQSHHTDQDAIRNRGR
jgi:hypothetical protein